MTPDEARSALGIEPEIADADVPAAYRRKRAMLIEAGQDALVSALDKAEFWFSYHRRRVDEFAVQVDLLDGACTTTYEPIGRPSGVPLGEPLGAVFLPAWVEGSRDDGMAAAVRMRQALLQMGTEFTPAVVHGQVGSVSGVHVAREAASWSEISELIADHLQGPVVLLWDAAMQVLPHSGLPVAAVQARVSVRSQSDDPVEGWQRDQAALEDRERRKTEEKQKRKEAKRERKEKHQELEKQLRADGWPAAWSPKMVAAWTEAGGDLHSAQQLAFAGWTVKECKQALQYLTQGSSLLPDILAMPAEVRRSSGDALDDLLSGAWPPSPVGTRLSVKRQTADGVRTRDMIVGDGGALTLQHAAVSDGEWRIEERPSDAGAFAVLLLLRPDLLSFDLDVMAWIDVVDPDDLDDIMNILALTGLESSADRNDEALSNWSDQELAERWQEEDEFLEELLELPVTHRWVEVNGRRVVGIRSGDDLVPVLYSIKDEEFAPIRSLAEGSWFSESGGAPISWDGGSELALLADTVVMERTWGDVDPGLEVYALTSAGDKDLVDLVVTWTLAHDYEAAAAIALEPLDPRGELDASSRDRWDHLLGSVDVSYDVDSRISHHVRSELVQRSALYQAITTAFQHPTTPLGGRLLAALEDVAEERVLGPLTSGVWAADT